MDPNTWLIIGISIFVLTFVAAAALFSTRIVRVPADQALVVVGRRSVIKATTAEIEADRAVTRTDGETAPSAKQRVSQTEQGFTIIKGGRTFLKPVIEEAKWLGLETHTVAVEVPDVITKSGVRLTVDVITQVKIRSDTLGLIAAAEQLLDKTEAEIQSIAQKNLEGHIRSACAQLDVETINSDRMKLASRIQEEAVPDLAKLGLEITTFTVKDIKDKVGYLDALGAKRTAEVLRDAKIGKAEAERDAEIRVAQAKRDQEAAAAEALEKDLKIKRITAIRDGDVEQAIKQAEIAEAEQERDVRMQAAVGETQRAKAKADVAYSIQEANAKQELAKQEKLLASLEADAEQERQRASTVVPAEAKAKEVAALASGEKEKVLRAAEAQAESIRLEGNATAEAILAKGKADAEALRLVSDAYKDFSENAVRDRIVAHLPEIARAMSAPLENVSKVVVLENSGNGDGGNSLLDWVNGGVTKLPEFVKALTGQDMVRLVRNGSLALQGKAGAGGQVLDVSESLEGDVSEP